ncbi:hypothetical protein LEP1GSC132_3059, partial [Leptospira kirschneri str. 200803703]
MESCFVAGTSIRMDSGFKAIEDVKIGDVIRSWNENTNTFENKRVTQTSYMRFHSSFSRVRWRRRNP